MPTRYLLAALLLSASPVLLADDVLDMDARITLGWELVLQVEDEATALVRAQSPAAATSAAEHLTALRDRGAADAAYQLGYAYLAGRFGIALDLQQSKRNFEIAITQELPEALGDYGLMLYTGHHFPRDIERGLTLLNRSAELGYPPATAFLINYLQDRGVAEDSAKARAWLESMGMRDDQFVLGIDGDPLARAQEHAFGQAYIYAMYRDGVILTNSQTDAEAWFEQIDSEHLASALDTVAIMLSSTSNVRSNQALAHALQETAIAYDGRNPTIVNNHAWLLATARINSLRDGAKAVRLMQELFSHTEAEGFMIDTLAAAYAELGDFSAAIVEQERANAWYAAESQDFAIGDEHLDAYREGRAWRD